MPPSFRLGLIGAGRMGRTHMRAFAGSERVAVTAIAEVSEQARRAVEPSGAALYPGIGPMLDGAAVDGILITAPSDQHGRIISEVAAHGLPILCEKPCGGAGRGGGGGGVPGRVLAAVRARAGQAARADGRR
jgi:myo-inositol 2-dehydrogenase/D-chiro-inositol 1-dehydrogenase